MAEINQRKGDFVRVPRELYGWMRAQFSGDRALENFFEAVAEETTPRIDDKKRYFGSNKGVYFVYDGSDFYLSTGDVNPSDFIIDCGTGKTLVLAESVWLDEVGPLISAARQNPAAKVTTNVVEQTVDYADTATTATYSVITTQINHNWKPGTSLGLHLHWQQGSADVPNWLIQYRWQKNGDAKTTAWTSDKYQSHAFTYASGTLNQITTFTDIVAPGGYGISDIIQFRLIRDTGNASSLFAGADPLTGDAAAMSLDYHKAIDTIGSRQEYVK